MITLIVVQLLYCSFSYCESSFKVEMLGFSQNITFKNAEALKGENLADNLCNM